MFVCLFVCLLLRARAGVCVCVRVVVSLFCFVAVVVIREVNVEDIADMFCLFIVLLTCCCYF